jgi:hypothetical protein
MLGQLGHVLGVDLHLDRLADVRVDGGDDRLRVRGKFG